MISNSLPCVCYWHRADSNHTRGQEARGRRRLEKINELLPPPNGWQGGLVRGVLSAEPVLGLAIYQTLFKGRIGTAQRTVQLRRLQAPWRILSLRGGRAQYSKDNENKFHAGVLGCYPDNTSIKRRARA
jgi:hypothetical protein